MFSLKSMEKMLIKYGIFEKSETVNITLHGNELYCPDKYEVISHDGHFHQMIIRATDRAYIDIYKKNGIHGYEKKYTICLINVINEVLSKKIPVKYIDGLLKKSQIESVVHAATSGDYQCINLAILNTIDIFDNWSKETYETQNICAAVGFDPIFFEESDIDINYMMKDDMMKVMSNGIETFFLCNYKGKLINVEQIPEGVAPLQARMMPFVFSKIANWTQDDKIAVVLTQKGEILIFTKVGLTFARRRGRWIFINLKQASHVMGTDTRGSETVVRNAVLDTCLDVSFKRTGACIGIIAEGQPLPPCIQQDDILNQSTSPRAKFLKKIIAEKKFHELSRQIRQELAAIDGSIVLSGDGTILAAGAILNIAGSTPGRTTGGRSVAAQTLAKYGCGIKVSADGQIQAWGKPQQGTGPVVNLFTMA